MKTLDTCVLSDQRTVAKIKTEANIRDRTAQDLSTARLVALQDIRVVYKIVCAYLAWAGYLDAAYKVFVYYMQHNFILYNLGFVVFYYSAMVLFISCFLKF